VRFEHLEQLRSGSLKVIVDDSLVIARGKLKLAGRIRKTQVKGLFALRLATAETLFEDLHGRRLDEDENGIGKDLANVERALDVNLEDDGLTGAQVTVNLGGERAITVSVDVSPLEELPGLDATVEVIVGEEVVGNPVNLTWTWLSRCGRDRQTQVRALFPHKGNQCALPYA
jgi:hypothetical protein